MTGIWNGPIVIYMVIRTGDLQGNNLEHYKLRCRCEMMPSRIHGYEENIVSVAYIDAITCGYKKASDPDPLFA